MPCYDEDANSNDDAEHLDQVVKQQVAVPTAQVEARQDGDPCEAMPDYPSVCVLDPSYVYLPFTSQTQDKCFSRRSATRFNWAIASYIM